MTGLDTNVLVRYVTQDDRKQAAAASSVIDSAAEDGELLVIHPVVICELVWVLESAYDLSKPELAAVLEQILRTAQFEVLQKDTAWRALADYKSGRGDFSDYLIGRANSEAGAAQTVTFDKKLRRSPHFSVLSL